VTQQSAPQPSAPQPSAPQQSHRTRTLAAGVAAGVLGTSLVGGLGFAAASGSKAQPGASASTSATDGNGAGSKGAAGKRAGGKHLGAQSLGRVVHGEGVVRTRKGYQTVDVARGTLTVTGSTVTVKSADGVTSPAFTLGTDTAVRAAKKKATTAAVTTGKQGEVVGIKTATGLTARLVVVK